MPGTFLRGFRAMWAMIVSIIEKMFKQLQELWPMLKRIWRDWSGPEIEAKLLHPKPSTWLFEVQNTRGGTAICLVYLQKVTDGKDNDSGEVTSPIELYPSETLDPVR